MEYNPIKYRKGKGSRIPQHVMLFFIIAFALIAVAGRKENKKLLKWKREMIREVYQMAIREKGCFISLGIDSHHDPDSALQLSKLSALYALPEVNEIFVQSICRQEEIFISRNGKDTAISRFASNILCRSKLEVLLKNIRYEKFGQIFIDGKYFIASIAKVQSTDLIDRGLTSESTYTPTEKEFLKEVEKRFLDVYQDSLFKTFKIK